MEKQEIPPAQDLSLKSRKYQPSKAELEEKQDMPSMSRDQLRKAFMRPVRVVEKS